VSPAVPNSLKKCKVSIFGESYTLVTDESEEHVARAAQQVDALMRDITAKSQLTDSKRIAVLAALQFASKTLILQDIMQKTEEQSNKLIALLTSEAEQIKVP
jgi:cell division protein ZapA